MKLSLTDLVKEAGTLKVRYGYAKTTQIKEKFNLRKAKKRHANAVKAQTFVQSVAADVQQQVHDRIATLVTRCLAAVYDQPYQFRIKFEKRRGKTDARMVFVRKGFEREPKDVGGGVLDLAAFALRLACLIIRKPARRRVIVCDEPFKHLDATRKERVKDLLERLSGELQVQLVLVTHAQELTLGKVVHVR